MQNSETRSSVACTLIDGDKIRQIRRKRGFTQLYVATVLGVTTDTVSRWENNRSPSIKQENAEKLAEALEVDISEICHAEDKPRQEVSGQSEGNDGTARAKAVFSSLRQRLPLLLLIISSLAALLLLGYYLADRSTPPPAAGVTSLRILPARASSHQPFPVILAVDTDKDFRGSFILRETFPPSLSVNNGIPPFQALNTQQGKWIAAGGQGAHLFGYLALVKGQVKVGDELHFTGHLLIGREALPVAGSTSMKVGNYHWADRNADYIIDDSEILAIYSYFDLFQKLGVDIDEIQRIWAGNGYRWDKEKKKFVVAGQRTTTGEE